MLRELTRNDEYILEQVQKEKKIDITEKMVSEWLMCRSNPLYFILNYVYLPEIGGKIKYSSDIMHPKLRRVVRVVMRLHSCLFMATRQLGKALALNTLIPQPDGHWKTFGDIKVGDYVFHPSGRKIQVIETTDIFYNRPCYRISFNCGEEVVADENHEWKIDNIPSIIETKNLQPGMTIFGHEIIDIIKLSESVPVKCIQVDSADGLFLFGKTTIPTHNSSIAAALLCWAINFYPGNRALILNMQKRYAQENLAKIKFIHANLPEWMRIGRSSKSEIKEYFELKNGSRIDTLYPSSTTPPDSIARSLTLPILYIDEMAFIPHIDKIYGAAQPTLNRAREQAKKNNYPYFILATSTPNGVEGVGKFFADLWDLAMDSDDFFQIVDENKKIEDWVSEEEFQRLTTDPTKNNFVKIRYHWSEDPTKDENWYNNQKKELNFDMRKIRQELDLQFIGGQHCIFDDETLGSLVSRKKFFSVYMNHSSYLDVYRPESEIISNDYYLIGVDTASSLKGAYDAIEIFTFKEFEQIAELKTRLGSLTKYSEIVESVFRWLYNLVGDRIILCIENNSIGKSIIENLIYHPINSDIPYSSFIYYNREKDEYGINTNVKTKELMVSLLYEQVTTNPKIIKSNELISQLHRIERNNSGNIVSKSYTDLFMASCLCAFVRKLRYHEILPMLDYTESDFQKNIINNVKEMVSVSPKNILNNDFKKDKFDDVGIVILDTDPFSSNRVNEKKIWSFFGGMEFEE